jgi:hypothetical protein
MFIATLAVSTLLSLSPLGLPTDTVLPVSRGMRFDVDAGPLSGRVQIRGWARDEVRVLGATPARVTTENSLVRVRPTSPLPRGQTAWEIDVPNWMAVSVTSTQANVTVEGVAADVGVQSVGGTVRVSGGSGRVSARSGNQSVRVSGASGQVQAEAVNGSVRLERIRSDDVFATSVNGSIDFDGPILDGGRYRLSSHNGRIGLTVQEDANATVTVTTYNGRFQTAFPITITELGAERRTTFVLGTGSAPVEASSFNGNIDLRRPGSQR